MQYSSFDMFETVKFERLFRLSTVKSALTIKFIVTYDRVHISRFSINLIHIYKY